MTVKELIEQLQRLDQNKPIWVLYDMVYPKVPTIEVTKEDDVVGEINEGDYYIEAW